MKKMRKSLLAAALAIAFGTGAAAQALAGVHVSAAVHVPGVRIHVGSIPSGHYGYRTVRRLPVRGRVYYEITRGDRIIARRLTSYTGAPLGEMIRLRRRGYSWFEIGHWLRMPRPAVCAAMTRSSWNTFLREERRNARPYGSRRQKVTYYDGMEYGRR